MRMTYEFSVSLWYKDVDFRRFGSHNFTVQRITTKKHLASISLIDRHSMNCTSHLEDRKEDTEGIDMTRYRSRDRVDIHDEIQRGDT